MAFFYLAPDWFFGYDIALELLFGLVTALVAFFSFKVYNICGERECKYLGFAFGSISIAYFLWPLLNLFALSKGEGGINTLALNNLSAFILTGIYLHVVLFILGLATIAYLTFNVRNNNLYALLVSLSIIGVIMSTRVGWAFNFVAAVLLFYVSLYYLSKYRRAKDHRIFLVASAFVLLFFARIVLILATRNHLLYVVNHVVEFIAYVLIAISLVKTLRK
jgi:hypothetical protein